MMLPSLKRFTVMAGVTCAIAGAGPVAAASAAPAPSIPTVPTIPSIPTIPLPSLPSLGLLFPEQSSSPGQSCTDNQGLFPGVINYGPTGPFGPLGPSGPLGGRGSLPCGDNALNLGPSGPLGPHGQLGVPAANS